ncbi:MAG: hypothetical protein KAX49_11450 [Halanaerobiales bacterium]|nr:hypothetical protein [Halanaerobiales bacterium]
MSLFVQANNQLTVEMAVNTAIRNPYSILNDTKLDLNEIKKKTEDSMKDTIWPDYSLNISNSSFDNSINVSLSLSKTIISQFDFDMVNLKREFNDIENFYYRMFHNIVNQTVDLYFVIKTYRNVKDNLLLVLDELNNYDVTEESERLKLYIEAELVKPTVV